MQIGEIYINACIQFIQRSRTPLMSLILWKQFGCGASAFQAGARTNYPFDSCFSFRCYGVELLDILSSKASECPPSATPISPEGEQFHLVVRNCRLQFHYNSMPWGCSNV